MLAQERHQQILNLLEERGTVRTIDLAEEFEVTDETIRRDLQNLADSGRLARIHGGASSLSGRPKLQSFTERRSINVENKRRIARSASKLIQPGLTYAFDSSTTVFELVCALPDDPFRVVTNAFAVVDQLIGHEQIEVICTGGRYHPKTHTFVGGDSIDTLRRHNINTAFISCIGFDATRGASEGFEQQATFKERLVRFADKVILLVDSTKLSERSEYFFAGIDQISKIITDNEADPSLVRELVAAGCSVTLAE
ncbi:MAG: DeoR/GlpR family DNA-binding transcription regulator [Verrucomicrobiota bacterium]